MAKKFGYEVKPSSLKHKKIDVYKDGERICSVGYKGMMDYGMYLEEKGKAYADERRRLYRIRHPGDSTGERLAKQLLW
jgi:hypothetical protein